MVLFIKRPNYIGSLRARTHTIYSILLPFHDVNFGPVYLEVKIPTPIFYLTFKLLARSESQLQQHHVCSIAAVPKLCSADRKGTADAFL